MYNDARGQGFVIVSGDNLWFTYMVLLPLAFLQRLPSGQPSHRCALYNVMTDT
uniref:hypothetical protein n=1 Tax=Segatella hominis TaxID=2518605 RepID=UPI0040276031